MPTNFEIPKFDIQDLSAQAGRQVASMNRTIDALHSVEAKRNSVPLEIAKNTKQINEKVKSIDENVSAERSERKTADIELQKAIDEVRRIQRLANIKALAVGIICAAAGVLFSIIAKEHGLL